MISEMKQHIDDYKADMKISVRSVVDEKLRKKREERCTEVWEIAAQCNWGKTLEELEIIVKKQEV